MFIPMVHYFIHYVYSSIACCVLYYLKRHNIIIVIVMYVHILEMVNTTGAMVSLCCYIRAVRVAPGLPNWDAGVVWEGTGRPVMWPVGSTCPLVTGVDTATDENVYGTHVHTYTAMKCYDVRILKGSRYVQGHHASYIVVSDTYLDWMRNEVQSLVPHSLADLEGLG